MKPTHLMNLHYKMQNILIDVDGVLLLNKPQGLTSNAALQKIKRLYNAKKAGHTGSLDPLATGMLPVCFGKATKFSQHFLNADKLYEVTGLLGFKTDSGDSQGTVLKVTNDFKISSETLLEALENFKGKIKQIPPMYAAIKHKGVPLYKYARQGINIERVPREIIIHKLDLVNFENMQFTLQVLCSKGTYIRSLIDDLGDLLGVGAHVIKLHRVYTAGFANLAMYTLESLDNTTIEERFGCLLSMEMIADITSVPF